MIEKILYYDEGNFDARHVEVISNVGGYEFHGVGNPEEARAVFDEASPFSLVAIYPLVKIPSTPVSGFIDYVKKRSVPLAKLIDNSNAEGKGFEPDITVRVSPGRLKVATMIRIAEKLDEVRGVEEV
jgi:hypothetical protein